MVRYEKFRKTVNSDKINVSEYLSDSDTDASNDKSTCEKETLVDVCLPIYQKDTVVDDCPVRLPPLLRRGMPTLARACDRHELSDRSAAAVVSAVLKDFGLITATDSSNVIDQNKIRRERKKTREELRASELSDPLHCLCFPWRSRSDASQTRRSRGECGWRHDTEHEAAAGHCQVTALVFNGRMNMPTIRALSPGRSGPVDCDGSPASTNRLIWKGDRR